MSDNKSRLCRGLKTLLTDYISILKSGIKTLDSLCSSLLKNDNCEGIQDILEFKQKLCVDLRLFWDVLFDNLVYPRNRILASFNFLFLDLKVADLYGN